MVDLYPTISLDGKHQSVAVKVTEESFSEALEKRELEQLAHRHAVISALGAETKAQLGHRATVHVHEVMAATSESSSPRLDRDDTVILGKGELLGVASLDQELVGLSQGESKEAVWREQNLTHLGGERE